MSYDVRHRPPLTMRLEPLRVVYLVHVRVKGVFERKFVPQMAVFEAKRGEKLNFWFCDPQKARPCAEPRLLTYFASKSVRASWL